MFTMSGNKSSRTRSFRLHVVYKVLTLLKRLFVSGKCFCLKEVIFFQSCLKAIISESKRFIISSLLSCDFLFDFIVLHVKVPMPPYRFPSSNWPILEIMVTHMTNVPKLASKMYPDLVSRHWYFCRECKQM